MTNLRLGLNPRDPNALFVRLTPHLLAITAPIAIDWHSKVASWGMMLNDQLGDCTCASCGHLILQQSTYGNRPVLVTDGDVLKEYEFAGYVPGNPATDQGWTVQASLDYLVKYGLAGVQIQAYGEIDHTNHNAVKLAVFEFGALSIGVNLPKSAMQQFQAGQPWTVVSSAIDGGHCILVVGYDTDYVYAVTWGQVVKIAWTWWDAYVTEAWAVITEDWDTVTGLSLTAFGAEWAEMTGGANPFAVPVQPPAPLPPLPKPIPSRGWFARFIDWLLTLIGA
jgi:hypothetical protein